jgi:hypothetical protein
MAACATCGASLGFRRRLSGADQCEECERKAKAATESALASYDLAVAAVIRAVSAQSPEAGRLLELERVIEDGKGSFEVRKLAAYRRYLDAALADEILTEDEEQRLVEVGEALYRTPAKLGEVLAPYRPQILVAMVNGGRLPVVNSSRIMLKKGEVVHLEEEAGLLKEVVQREFQSGSRGMSFRIAKGVSYRVGASRGKMVEVGRSWELEDEGPLSVTSHRMVFAGTRRTVEVAYSKLLNFEVYSDAIQIHVSNRQKPTTFRVSDGPMIGALVNGATQRLLE